MLNFYWKIISDLKQKVNLVSLQVQIAHFLIAENPEQTGKFFGKKTVQKLGRNENNPLAVIVTFLTIYWEVLPSMIDVVTITPW